MRRATLAFSVAMAIGLVAIAIFGLTRSSSLVYSLGVNPALAAVELTKGDRACQAPIRIPDGNAFDRVGVRVGTFFKPGPALRVEVIDDRSGSRLATGRLPAGYPDVGEAGEQLVPVGRVQTTAPLRVCVVNEDAGHAAIYGQVGVASPITSATLNEEPYPNDMALNLHGQDKSLLALLPDIADRAARFRAGWVSPLVYLVLALALVAGVPVLLARGIARAAAEGQDRAST